MAKPKKQRGVLFLRNIPPDVKAQYKAYCAKRGTNMTEDVVNYMIRCIRNPS